MRLFEERKDSVPVWFMRQAGRYHKHYQGLRAKHGFMDLCKKPELACEVTLGPIEDFDFDAAILFSDLLFPLEFLGLGLSYDKGPPELALKITSQEIIRGLEAQGSAEDFFFFQKRALSLIKEALPKEKTLLGFVGAPFTLYAYALEGSHKDGLHQSKRGLADGRFKLFLEKLLPVLKAEMEAQAEADCLCLFDTAAGELSPEDFKSYLLPSLKELIEGFKAKHPSKKVLYYSRGTNRAHLRLLREIQGLDALGIDWKNDLHDVLNEFGESYFIQGNIDPDWLFLPWDELEKRLVALWEEMKDQPFKHKWIFGLGHGVLPGTPEENVRKTVAFVKSHKL